MLQFEWFQFVFRSVYLFTRFSFIQQVVFSSMLHEQITIFSLCVFLLIPKIQYELPAFTRCSCCRCCRRHRHHCQPTLLPLSPSSAPSSTSSSSLSTKYSVLLCLFACMCGYACMSFSLFMCVWASVSPSFWVISLIFGSYGTFSFKPSHFLFCSLSLSLFLSLRRIDIAWWIVLFTHLISHFICVLPSVSLMCENTWEIVVSFEKLSNV